MPSLRPHRLVVLGADRVGKTALIEQLIFGNHVLGQGGPPTIGDIYETCVETEKGTGEKLQIFDTPGSLFSSTKENQYEQDHFLSIADGCILVYEIPSKASYDLVVTLRQKISAKNKDLPIVIIGNKADLNAIREVDFSFVKEWAKAHGLRAYETTVLDRDGLKEPFCYIGWRMANPHAGRPFHQLPSITSTPARSSASPQSQHLEKPDKPLAERPPPDSNQPDSPDFERTPVSNMYPDDATFPKHGAGLFTFADCLSSKSRRFHEGQ